MKKSSSSLSLFVLILCSCATPSSQWDLETEKTFTGYQSARLTFSSDSFTSLELQFDSNERVYLNTNAGLFPESECGFSPIVLKSQNETFHVQAHRFTGGQRLLLPPYAAEWIIDHLLKGKDISISSKRLILKISSADFYTKYRDFLFAQNR